MIAGTPAVVDDAERAAILLEAPQRLPVFRAPCGPERERRQIDLRLLAELDERQPEVGVAMQMRSGHFVEDRRAAEIGAALEKQCAPERTSRSAGPTGSPSATQVRPWTAYITNAERVSSKSSALSRR